MEVIALTGPSGTGKSHRALLVAYQERAEIIIDDGLIIKGSRILGGISAKKQKSQLAAIRTALFTDDAHAAEARALLKKENPNRVLILATSREMADRIAQRLELPAPQKYISIEEVASPREIKIAAYQRHIHGRHVIPAPTAEVKRTVKGLLQAAPLFIHLPAKGKKGSPQIEKTVVRPPFSMFGGIYVADSAVIETVKFIIKENFPKVKVKGTAVEQTPAGLSLHLSLSAPFGLSLPELGRAIQQKVKTGLSDGLGLPVIQVDITFSGLHIPSQVKG